VEEGRLSPQETRVGVLDENAGADLAERLTRAGYRLRPAPYARFLAQGEGVTATLYKSGKLVLQGQGLDLWEARFLGGKGLAASGAAGKGDEPIPDAQTPALGSDEAGKGDTFGPLVVAGFALGPGMLETVRGWRITDSKQMMDAVVRVAAANLREAFPASFEERVLEPAEYNRRHAEAGSNVNVLLAALHAEVLAALWKRSGIAVAVVDRFARSKPLTKHFEGKGLKVFEVPRAERHAAVAAASVLARDRFLESMHALEEVWAVDLPLGSGAPVERALRRFLQIHGPGKLGEAAKLHFKNVRRHREGG